MNVWVTRRNKGRRSRARMVVGLTTTYGSGAYHHWCCRISIKARCKICDKVCQRLATGRWTSPGPPVSITNKTDRHDVESGAKHHQRTNKTNRRLSKKHLDYFYHKYLTWLICSQYNPSKEPFLLLLKTAIVLRKNKSRNISACDVLSSLPE